MFDSPFRKKVDDIESLSTLSPAEVWRKLGLIDKTGVPTERGIIFSFSRGEGLAVAVGLEDPTYPIEEFVYDLANLSCRSLFQGIC